MWQSCFVLFAPNWHQSSCLCRMLSNSGQIMTNKTEDVQYHLADFTTDLWDHNKLTFCFTTTCGKMLLLPGDLQCHVVLDSAICVLWASMIFCCLKWIMLGLPTLVLFFKTSMLRSFDLSNTSANRNSITARFELEWTDWISVRLLKFYDDGIFTGNGSMTFNLYECNGPLRLRDFYSPV